MNALAVIAGSQASVVLSHQWESRSQRAMIGQLQAKLDSLVDKNDQLANRLRDHVDGQQAELDKLCERMQSARARYTKITRQSNQLGRTLSSFWGRLGVRLRHWFSSGAPSLDALRQQHQELEGNCDTVADQVDDLEHATEVQRANLRKLAEPLDSLEHAIEHLGGMIESAEHAAREHEAAVLEQIKGLAAQLDLVTLGRRVQSLPKGIEVSELVAKLLQLKGTILQRQAMPAVPEIVAAEPILDTVTDNLVAAIQGGFMDQAQSCDVTLDLHGKGTKHIKKTRARTHTRRDSEGRLRHETMQETYWDPISVFLEGDATGEFKLTTRHWQAESITNLLRDETVGWFRCGVDRCQGSFVLQRCDEQSRKADVLAHEILAMLDVA